MPLLSRAFGASPMDGGSGFALARARDRIDAQRKTEPAPTPGCLADRALFDLYCGNSALAQERLARAFELLPNYELGPQLIGGLAHVAWVAAHVTARGVDIDAADSLDALDDLFQTTVAARRHDFDFASGLVGIGVYALERGAAGRALVRTIVEQLRRSAVEVAGCLRWSRDLRTPRALGMAHGNAGVVAFLSHAASCDPLAMDILRPAAAWFVRAVDGGPGNLPSTGVWRGASSHPCAWCGGQLGIATALAQAGRILRDAAMLNFSYEVARSAAATLAGTGPFDGDTSLCHGAAGAAHAFAVLAVSGNDSDGVLASAAVRCYCSLVTVPGEAAEGRFPPRRPRSPPTWMRMASLLESPIGALLSLQAGTQWREPDWDHFLLCRERSQPAP
jgi:hypothetical protein